MAHNAVTHTAASVRAREDQSVRATPCQADQAGGERVTNPQQREGHRP